MPGSTLSRVFEDTNPFLPVAIGMNVRMVARSAIACMSAHVMHVSAPDAELARLDRAGDTNTVERG